MMDRYFDSFKYLEVSLYEVYSAYPSSGYKL
jgi:hypothetical protein